MIHFQQRMHKVEATRMTRHVTARRLQSCLHPVQHGEFGKRIIMICKERSSGQREGVMRIRRHGWIRVHVAYMTKYSMNEPDHKTILVKLVRCGSYAKLYDPLTRLRFPLSLTEESCNKKKPFVHCRFLFQRRIGEWR
jgi:hypothetical protein